MWKCKALLYKHKQLYCSCKDVGKDVGKKFDTSVFETDKPLYEGKNEKVIGLMTDELEGKSWKNLLH